MANSAPIIPVPNASLRRLNRHGSHAVQANCEIQCLALSLSFSRKYSPTQYCTSSEDRLFPSEAICHLPQSILGRHNLTNTETSLHGTSTQPQHTKQYRAESEFVPQKLHIELSPLCLRSVPSPQSSFLSDTSASLFHLVARPLRFPQYKAKTMN